MKVVFTNNTKEEGNGYSKEEGDQEEDSEEESSEEEDRQEESRSMRGEDKGREALQE